MAYYILLFTFPFLLMPFSSLSTDPSPLQDFCIADLNSRLFVNGFPCKNPATVTSKDFFYDGLSKKSNSYDGFGVNVLQGSVFQFPGLNTLGMSLNRASFLLGAFRQPHVHPRATELALVVEGSFLFGLISTANVLYSKVVSAGELAVIPPAMLHLVLNVGHGNGTIYAAFNSQNPGVQYVGSSLFNSTPSIVDEVLSKAFLVNSTTINFIKLQFQKLK